MKSKEEEAIEQAINKLREISVLVEGKDLIGTGIDVSAVTQRVIEELSRGAYLPHLLPTYHICDTLFVERGEVVAYIGKDYIDTLLKNLVVEETLCELMWKEMPKFFPKDKDGLSTCDLLFAEEAFQEGLEFFFEIISKSKNDNLDLEEAKAKANEISRLTNFIEFAKEFNEMVFVLFPDINQHVVQDNAYAGAKERFDDIMSGVKYHLNRVRANCVRLMELTHDNEIKIVFDPPEEFYTPNFINLFEDTWRFTLNNCITLIESEYRKGNTLDWIIKEYEREIQFDNLSERILGMFLVETFPSIKKGKNIKDKLIEALLYAICMTPTKIKEISPTELGLKICDALDEIKESLK